MSPKVNKNTHETKSSTKLTAPVILDERVDEVMKASYPLSFLLLESEDDSFVKGYN